jgi:hypothetical protein
MVTMGNMQTSLRRIVGIVMQGSSQGQVASEEIASTVATQIPPLMVTSNSPTLTVLR